MRTLESWSERFPPRGGSAGEGILKNLGTPPLEKLELFTREIIQNCWDAADPGREGPVSVAIRCNDIDNETIARIRSDIFTGARRELRIESAFVESPRLLVVSDRGTHGLAGPTRADIAVDGPTDFRDFIRNVGEPPDKELGGGSFGFGKAALYLVSLAHCIIVHTRARNEEGQLETRLMAAGLSVPFEEMRDGRAIRFTGRHAWGVATDEDFVEPARGVDCDGFVDLLGLTAFEEDETGTDVVIVAPDLALGGHDSEDRHPEQAMELIARSVAWHFWPKIFGPSQTMDIAVSLNGEEVALPNPANEPRLAAFVNALYELDGQEPPSTPGRSEKYRLFAGVQKKYLGDMVLQTHLIPRRESPEVKIAAPDGNEPLNHVALMRNAELVVRYVSGPELPAGSGGYAGVFRVKQGDVELDNVFRASEPPSHDDWIPQALEDRNERMYVNRAVKGVEENMEKYVGIETPTGVTGDVVPLGQFSRQLASLVPSIAGEGARREPSGSGGAQRSKAPIEIRERLRPTVVNGEAVLQSTVRAVKAVSVSATPHVVSEGSAERVPPEGAPLPKVLKWVGPSGREVSQPTVEMEQGEDWTIVVSSPGDSRIRVNFETES
jgi:hypothetical protein